MRGNYSVTVPAVPVCSYDAFAHLAEETHAANATMPYATVNMLRFAGALSSTAGVTHTMHVFATLQVFCVATVALLGALLIAGLNANIQVCMHSSWVPQ